MSLPAPAPADFSGLWIPLVTPFREGRIDHDALAALCRRLAAQGIAGFVVCGSTGEAAALDDAEQLAVLHTVAAAAPQLRRLFGVGGWHLGQVLDKVLQTQNQKRHVTFTAAHALGLASVLSESDLLLTLPSRLVSAITFGRTQLVVRPLPIDSPEMAITLQWHTRVHRDPAVTWLRRSIVDIFSTPDGG